MEAITSGSEFLSMPRSGCGPKQRKATKVSAFPVSMTAVVNPTSQARPQAGKDSA